ncbi:phage major capsid protein [Clostridium perfringens]|uniref:major capsid protein n=1 Tax=Clostridium perfringens TaxID=1502 RepID=UPI0034A2CEC2|nr:phage major capsid protein [Clostridium perfringens]MDM0781021.1 phage major capsid protein [Clostridium perfringens]
MAMTLIEANKLTQNMLQKGVIETMAKTSGVLQRLPFVEVVGSGYAYNLVEELPEVGYRAVNGQYTENTAGVEQMVESLVILGGDADVDVFLTRTHSNLNDLRAMQTELKAKATARQFEMDFFKGTGTSDALKGLDKRLAEGKVGTEIKKALSYDALNELLDAVVDGADCLFMSKKMRRSLLAILQKDGHYIESGSDAFGRPISMYGGVEIVPVEDSLIPANKVYAVKFGTDQYVHGLSNGGVQVRDLGELDTKPCYRTRIEFYCGLATKHKKCFAVLDTTGLPS